MQLKLFYSFIVLLLAWLGQGLHPTYLASTALLSALYFGALVLPGHLHFALLFQLLPLAAGRLLASVSALKLLPGIQGALVGLPVALLLAIPPVLAVHVAKINRSTIVFTMTWTVFNCLLARITPLGHFASWQGSSTPNLYWISSTLGFPGLDFFQALLAGALAQLLAAATAAVEPKHPQVSLMEDEDSEHRPLLSHVVGNNSIQVTRAAALRARRPALLALGLVALSSLPPSHIQYSTSTYRVGCALPQDRHQDTAGYLHESRVSASRGARIVLWPETAVYLSNEKELHALESQLFDISKTYGCHIGATYALKKDNKMENSFALIGPESATALVTYSKRHLLPLVESFPTRQGREAAPTYNFDVPLLSFCKSHVHDKGSISVVPQICHDTSFPVWTEQTPSLMLVPVNVPEVSIGEARLDELKERSRETNSAVLFCDASPRGVSGLLDQRGWVRALQFGGQGTFEADVPFQTHTRSPPLYARLGDQGSLASLLVGVILVRLFGQYLESGMVDSTKDIAAKGHRMLQHHVELARNVLPFTRKPDQQGQTASNGALIDA